MNKIAGSTECVAPEGFLKRKLVAELEQLHAQLAHHLSKAPVAAPGEAPLARIRQSHG